MTDKERSRPSAEAAPNAISNNLPRKVPLFHHGRWVNDGEPYVEEPEIEDDKIVLRIGDIELDGVSVHRCSAGFYVLWGQEFEDLPMMATTLPDMLNVLGRLLPLLREMRTIDLLHQISDKLSQAGEYSLGDVVARILFASQDREHFAGAVHDHKVQQRAEAKRWADRFKAERAQKAATS